MAGAGVEAMVFFIAAGIVLMVVGLSSIDLVGGDLPSASTADGVRNVVVGAFVFVIAYVGFLVLAGIDNFMSEG